MVAHSKQSLPKSHGHSSKCLATDRCALRLRCHAGDPEDVMVDFARSLGPKVLPRSAVPEGGNSNKAEVEEEAAEYNECPGRAGARNQGGQVTTNRALFGRSRFCRVCVYGGLEEKEARHLKEVVLKSASGRVFWQSGMRQGTTCR